MTIYNPTTVALTSSIVKVFESVGQPYPTEIEDFTITVDNINYVMYRIEIDGEIIYNSGFLGSPPTTATNAMQPWSKISNELDVVKNGVITLTSNQTVRVYAQVTSGSANMDVYVRTRKAVMM